MLNEPGLIKTFIATTDIKRFTVVAIDSAVKSVRTAVDVADPLLGVSAEPGDVVAGKRVHVIFTGIAQVLSGAVVAKGTWLTVDTQGRVIKATGATNERIGRALEAANAADEVIPVEIIKGLG